ncbi:MAG: nucleoside hydrolase, partial [Nitrospiraceae bacterium]
ADPEIVRKIRTIICMGGAIHTPGNVTPAAEFNIFVDPEAAQQVFQSGLPITLVPLDVTTKVALSRKDIRTMVGHSADPVCRFVRDATGKALDYSEHVEGSPLFQLHDPLAVSVAVNPGLVRILPLHVEVETEGRITRGMTVADRRSLRSPFKATPNLHVALGVDAARTLRLFQDRLCRR